jgi:ATP-dependent DNA ligase
MMRASLFKPQRDSEYDACCNLLEAVVLQARADASYRSKEPQRFLLKVKHNIREMGRDQPGEAVMAAILDNSTQYPLF